MKAIKLWIVLSIAVLMSGCATKSDINNLQNILQSQIDGLKAEISSIKSTADKALAAAQAAESKAASAESAVRRAAAAEGTNSKMDRVYRRAPVEEMAEEKAALPEFPWPPPKASAFAAIPHELLIKPNNKAPRLTDVNKKLSAALEVTGHLEKSYYTVPRGFAMVTRLEQINPDGTPKEEPARWAIEVEPLERFSLRSYLRALFTANPGYFRIIVFIVTSTPFSQTDVSISREEAIAWLSIGRMELPNSIGQREYSGEHACTALIYEFEKPRSQNGKLWVPSRLGLTGRDHLTKAGLWAALQR